jgi:hypothetical protein
MVLAAPVEPFIVNTVSQIGLETTARGTAAGANRLLSAVTWRMRPNIASQMFKPQGSKFNSLAALGREFVDTELEGYSCYRALPYLFNSLFTIVAPTGSGTAKTRVWAPAIHAIDNPQSYTLEENNDAYNIRSVYNMVNGLEIPFSRDAVTLRGTGFGRAIEPGTTATTPFTEITPQPILGRELNVYIDTTLGGIGTTKLTRDLSGTFRFNDKYQQLWVVDRAQPSFVTHTERREGPTAEISLVMARKSDAGAFFTNIRNGTTMYVRIDALGPAIAGGGNFVMQIDAAMKFARVTPGEDQDVKTFEWIGTLVADPAWGTAGQAVQVTITNDIATD